ncbi:hypothetical protein [Marinobacter sp.]|uniref:hypothetical protein n=1 Tax=Marinobacter sp. TaxID=50741 RepID=UPI00235483F9|nr:hypothetical protein [Marinobacter sp.]
MDEQKMNGVSNVSNRPPPPLVNEPPKKTEEQKEIVSVKDTNKELATKQLSRAIDKLV